MNTNSKYIDERIEEIDKEIEKYTRVRTSAVVEWGFTGLFSLIALGYISSWAPITLASLPIIYYTRSKDKYYKRVNDERINELKNEKKHLTKIKESGKIDGSEKLNEKRFMKIDQLEEAILDDKEELKDCRRGDIISKVSMGLLLGVSFFTPFPLGLLPAAISIGVNILNHKAFVEPMGIYKNNILKNERRKKSIENDLVVLGLLDKDGNRIDNIKGKTKKEENSNTKSKKKTSTSPKNGNEEVNSKGQNKTQIKVDNNKEAQEDQDIDESFNTLYKLLLDRRDELVNACALAKKNNDKVSYETNLDLLQSVQKDINVLKPFKENIDKKGKEEKGKSK